MDNSQRRAESMPKPKPKPRFWVEAAAGTLFLFLAVVTMIDREWMETLFGADPDGGTGAAEWAVVLGFGLAAALCAALARRDWHRLRAVTA